jgi:C-terminal processing protease CtpA/Prc
MMKSIIKPIILLVLSVIGFTACQEFVLGPDEPNNPEHIFELLWNDFDAHYALFDVKGIDWEELYAEYRPKITSETSSEELWQTITEMLLPLDDEHVKLRHPEEQRVFSSGEQKNLHALDEFSIQLIASNYVEVLYQTDDYFSFGKLYNHDIGYIHLIAMLGEDPTVIYEVLDTFRDMDAIIVDVRNNIGGNDEYAHLFAGGFSDGKHFIYTVETRNGPGHSDFDSPKKHFTEPMKPQNFSKPVVLLTDHYTVSGGEIFTLNMKAFGHVTHIGTTTAGAHSDVGPARFLPNGWSYEYSIQKYLMPDGESLEGIGITPDIHIQNSKKDIENGLDRVLEHAIHYLKNQI